MSGLKIEITSVEDDAMLNDPTGEAARILREIAAKIENNITNGSVYDSNGVKVGKWSFDIQS
jgi:hypothetical protein